MPKQRSKSNYTRVSSIADGLNWRVNRRRKKLWPVVGGVLALALPFSGLGGVSALTVETTWGQLGADLDGTTTNDFFGWSTAMSDDGTILAVGSRSHDSSRGHVRVFQWDGTTWNQLGADIDGAAEGDSFGERVALSSTGLTLAVGAPGNDGTGTNAGHVRVFGFSGGNWNQLGSDIDAEAAYDNFGQSVALSANGNRVVIGATGNDTTALNAGQVRVFDLVMGEWFQAGPDINGADEGDDFGRSVDISDDGSRIVVGAKWTDTVNDTNVGSAYIYDLNTGTGNWDLGQTFVGEAAADTFGGAVSMSGDGTVVAVGATGNDGSEGGTNWGHVRVFQDNSGTWSQLGADIDGEAAVDNSGASVDLSADGMKVAIGAGANDDAGIGAGHVRVFEYSNSTWTQFGNDIDGVAAGDTSGYAVSLSADGSIVAVGAPMYDGNGTSAGHARVFTAAETTLLDITYDSQGGTAVADGDATTPESGSIATLPTAPTREGYTFNGWYTASSGGTQITSGAAHNQTTDFTLYAQWTAGTVLIDYNGNGGTPGTFYDNCTVGDSATIITSAPTRPGYVLAGWNTAADGTGTDYGMAGNPYSCPTADLILYAQWTPLGHMLYDWNYGGGPVQADTCEYGSTYSVGSATTPTRGGHTFSHWNTAEDGTGTDYAASGDTIPCPEGTEWPGYAITFYAQWTEDPVDNDGDGLDSSEDPDDSNPDIDGDGVLDGDEETGCINIADCDSDGLPDNVDSDDSNPDQDGDGVDDGSEEDGCVLLVDCDADGLPDGEDPADTNPDADGDGVLDGDEETGCVLTTDCDGDGLPDGSDSDDNNPDQDGDGVDDGAEEDGCVLLADCDADGLPDNTDDDDGNPDQDGDGVLDGDEDAGCVNIADCDNDGLTDDVDSGDTNPDQDGDGVHDGGEEDGCVLLADCDADGLPDNDDSDDGNPDQDGDGVLDGDEDPACITDPSCGSEGPGTGTPPDTETPPDGGDGGSICLDILDCDADGLPGSEDGDDGDPDQDDDGVLDGDEEDGCVLKVDCDYDGLPDGDDPNDTNPDQDGDGVADGSEEDGCMLKADCDYDGLPDGDDPNDTDPDTDSDGVLDGDETSGCISDPTCGTEEPVDTPSDGENGDGGADDGSGDDDSSAGDDDSGDDASGGEDTATTTPDAPDMGAELPATGTESLPLTVSVVLFSIGLAMVCLARRPREETTPSYK